MPRFFLRAVLVMLLAIVPVQTLSESTRSASSVARNADREPTSGRRAMNGKMLSASRALLKRVVPDHADRFVLEAIPAELGSDVFELESVGDRVAIRGNSGVAIASGLNWYLKYHCQCHYSITGGSQMRLPNPLPRISSKVRMVCQSQYRYFLNYCCFGYSLPWYHWPQWEKLIDWMALNGVNVPLSVTGQEAVWQAVGRELGWGKEAMKQFLAGPPYLPFGWMGCLDGHGAPLPQSWIDGHVVLQKKILARERELGMKPVLQGFTGHIPPVVTNRVPGVKVQKITWIEWNTHLLDPLDPEFARIAAAFMKQQTRLYGTDHYYAADTFIEMIPPTGDTNYLAGIGRSIYDGLRRADPQAVWVLQGWPFFYARDFWTQPRIAAVLGAVPDSQVLLLDLYCENTPVWSRTEAFCGKPWLWCNIQNFGDRVFLGGALAKINREYFAARANPDAKRLSGLGFVNEGLDHNPAVFDFLLEMAWRKESVDLSAWLRGYSHRSYGQSDSRAEEAWKLLEGTVFQEAYDNPGACTMLPSLGDPPKVPYDKAQLAKAWWMLLQSGEKLSPSDSFRFDLVNLGRQVLANYSGEVHRAMLEAYQHRDERMVRAATSRMVELLHDMDRLLGTRQEFLLGRWLEDAKAWGKTEAEKQRLEWNARRVLTLWGNQIALRDYSCRQWSGMLSGFYAKRWELFGSHLTDSVRSGKPFDEAAFAKAVFAEEQRFSDSQNSFSAEPRGDSLKIAFELSFKYPAALAP